MSEPIRRRSFAEIRSALLDKREIALLDVREEDPHAQAHPLFAANFPLARIETNAYAKLPCRDVPIVTLDDGDGEAELAATRLIALGYTDVAVLDGGVSGWAAAGGELFRDVNVPSKAFGELVEAERHTPSLTAEAVHALIATRPDVLVVDARRFDEYQTMNIPGSISVPGGELVLRIGTLAADPETRIIVNCAGRTRSIIGAQSLINAGLPNPVAALRNGTIGWTLAEQALEHGQSRRYSDDLPECVRRKAAQAARSVAERAGVHRAAVDALSTWKMQRERTTYFFDVRSREEYEIGHLPGFRPTPGGQLVQETEMLAPVRGARIVLADNDGVRANMTGSWLAQMGWEIHVLDNLSPDDFSETGAWQTPLPPAPPAATISAQSLVDDLRAGEAIAIIDLSTSANYRKGHIPGAWYVQRPQLAEALPKIPAAKNWVLTCTTGQLAVYAAAELAALVTGKVRVLEGGTRAWQGLGLPLESGTNHLASEPTDRYRRPYEGTNNQREAMQGYLDWEFGLVEQLGRDGTHGFFVI